MANQKYFSSLHIGYLMQNGAPDLSTQSGPQLHTLAVITGLQKIGHCVRTVAMQNNRPGWSDNLVNWSAPKFGFTNTRLFRFFESALRRVQFELHLPFLGLFDSLHFADMCTNQLKGYDFLYERHGYLGYGGVIASRWLKIPLIIEINGNIIQEIDDNGIKMNSVQRALGRWITYKTWASATHLVAVSESLQHHLVNDLGIRPEKVSVVLNGVNIDVFTRSYDRDLLQKKFDLESGPIVTFVGSFQPWHGVDLLVSSYRKVYSEYPSSRLIIIGEGAQQGEIAELVTKWGLENNVRLMGRLSQEDVAAILSISDVVVAPYPFTHSKILGTPLKLLEYMAAGKAIVASTAPIHDIIIDGETGLRVPPADAAALADGILHLLHNDDLRKRLGSNAFLQVKQDHSWETTVDHIDKIIQAHLLSSNHGN